MLFFFISITLTYASFPQTIEGTDLVLQNSEGDMFNGWAAYVNEGNTEGAYVEADAIDKATWESIKQDVSSYSTYTTAGYDSITKETMECYSSAQGAINADSYSKAWLECYYSEGINYPITALREIIFYLLVQSNDNQTEFLLVLRPFQLLKNKPHSQIPLPFGP